MTINLTRDELMALVLISGDIANKALAECEKAGAAKTYRAWTALHKKLNDRLVEFDDNAALQLRG